jgi:hypothetical protein
MPGFVSGFGAAGPTPAERQALEVHLKRVYRSVIADPSLFRRIVPEQQMALRSVATRAIAAPSRVTEAEVQQASAALEAFFAARPRFANSASTNAAETVLTIYAAAGLLGAAMASCLAALLLKSGAVLRMMGIAIVDGANREVSRGRAVARAAIAWLPGFALGAYVTVAMAANARVIPSTAILAFAVVAAGAIVAVVSPTRGIQDRMAGTWLIPQ